MNRALVLVFLACGAPPARRASGPIEKPAPPSEENTIEVGPAPHAPNALVRIEPRLRKIEAPHGARITKLAATLDATAAISVDDLGGVRLWPKLDGTVEPRIVDLPRPRRLVLGTERRGFTIGLIDQAGGLVIQVVDADGITLQRATLPADPAFSGIAMTDRGLVALRSDQLFLRFADDGAIAERLPAEAGQRIASFAFTGKSGAAVIDDGKQRRARELVVAPKLGWRSWVPADPTVELGTQIAISPNGMYLASIRATRTQQEVVTVSMATGTPVTRDTMAVSARASIGFAGNGHVAVAADGQLTWLALDRALALGKNQNLDALEGDESGMIAVGDGRAITGAGGELVVATPARQDFLGYGIESPAVAAAGPEGRLVVGTGDAFVTLGPDLTAAAHIDFSIPPKSAVAELRWLHEQVWIVESSAVRDGLTQLALVDTYNGRTEMLRSGLPMVFGVDYEPSTKLVAISFGERPELMRFDPKRTRIDRLSAIAKQTTYVQTAIKPLAPALANGNHAVVASIAERLTLRWVGDARNLERGTAITIDGTYAAADAAGNVFVWQHATGRQLELVVYRDGKRIGVIPTDGQVTVWPSPRGGQTILVSREGVTLARLDGTRIWTQPVLGTNEAIWLTDGSIALLGTGGVARLDAANGTFLAARCGWRFGLSRRRHAPPANVEPMCTQMP